jgi:toxin ParE1/3/4
MRSQRGKEPAHLPRFEMAKAQGRIDEIVQVVQILTHSPLIGGPARGGSRELAIGRGAHGYVAFYRFVASIDAVFVLAIRSQRD